jgi:hypothetical protein
VGEPMAHESNMDMQLWPSQDLTRVGGGKGRRGRRGHQCALSWATRWRKWLGDEGQLQQRFGARWELVAVADERSWGGDGCGMDWWCS